MYTREGYETKFCIDHIFSRNMILSVAVIKTGISDHYSNIGGFKKLVIINNSHTDNTNNPVTL